MCCCAWFIPQKYLVHYFFRISFSRNNAFWLDQIDALEPQQALYIPSEKGYVVLEYVTAAFNFILASLLSAIIVILAIDSGCHFWWLLIFYPVIIYSSFAIYIAIRWSFIKPWNFNFNMSINENENNNYSDRNNMVFVYRHFFENTPNHFTAYEVDQFHTHNHSYYQRAIRSPTASTISNAVP